MSAAIEHQRQPPEGAAPTSAPNFHAKCVSVVGNFAVRSALSPGQPALRDCTCATAMGSADEERCGTVFVRHESAPRRRSRSVCFTTCAEDLLHATSPCLVNCSQFKGRVPSPAPCGKFGTRPDEHRTGFGPYRSFVEWGVKDIRVFLLSTRAERREVAVKTVADPRAGE